MTCSAKRIAAAGLLLLSSVNPQAAIVVSTWDAGNDDWNNAANWDPIGVPNNGADQFDVFITNGSTVTSGFGVGITIDNLTLNTGNTLRFEDVGSSLSVNTLSTIAGRVQAFDSAVIDLGGGTLTDAGLEAFKSIVGTNNASLTSTATTYTGSTSGTADRTLKSDGTGTVLDLSTLTSFTRPTSQFAGITILAKDGGTVNLSALASFTPNGGATQSNLNVTADGVSSMIMLPSVTAIADKVNYKAINGGSISGSLVTALNASLTLGGSGSVLDFSSLTDVSGSSVTAEDGGVVNLGAGTTIDDTSLAARKTIGGSDNAMLTSLATSWTGSTSGTTDRTLKADGTGTVLDLSTLTSFTRPTSQFAGITILAKDGGTVNLSAFASFTPNGGATQSNLSITSEDAGSSIDLSSLTSLIDGNLTFKNLGEIDIGSLGTLTGGTLTMDDSAGATNVAVASAFNLGDGGEIDMNGGSNALTIGTLAPTLGGAVNVFADGAFSGTGTILGDVTNHGSVGPGNSFGTLTVDGNYLQAAGATLTIEIVALNDFDVIDITGSAALDGSLEIIFNGYTPNSGDEFTFLMATLGLGSTTFANFTPASAAGFFLEVVYGADFAKIVVGSAVPLPPAVWMLLTGLAGTFAAARRSKG